MARRAGRVINDLSLALFVGCIQGLKLNGAGRTRSSESKGRKKPFGSLLLIG